MGKKYAASNFEDFKPLVQNWKRGLYDSSSVPLVRVSHEGKMILIPPIYDSPMGANSNAHKKPQLYGLSEWDVFQAKHFFRKNWLNHFSVELYLMLGSKKLREFISELYPQTTIKYLVQGAVSARDAIPPDELFSLLTRYQKAGGTLQLMGAYKSLVFLGSHFAALIPSLNAFRAGEVMRVGRDPANQLNPPIYHRPEAAFAYIPTPGAASTTVAPAPLRGGWNGIEARAFEFDSRSNVWDWSLTFETFEAFRDQATTIYDFTSLFALANKRAYRPRSKVSKGTRTKDLPYQSIEAPLQLAFEKYRRIPKERRGRQIVSSGARSLLPAIKIFPRGTGRLARVTDCLDHLSEYVAFATSFPSIAIAAQHLTDRYTTRNTIVLLETLLKSSMHSGTAYLHYIPRSSRTDALRYSFSYIIMDILTRLSELGDEIRIPEEHKNLVFHWQRSAASSPPPEDQKPFEEKSSERASRDARRAVEDKAGEEDDGEDGDCVELERLEVTDQSRRAGLYNRGIDCYIIVAVHIILLLPFQQRENPLGDLLQIYDDLVQLRENITSGIQSQCGQIAQKLFAFCAQRKEPHQFNARQMQDPAHLIEYLFAHSDLELRCENQWTDVKVHNRGMAACNQRHTSKKTSSMIHLSMESRNLLSALKSEINTEVTLDAPCNFPPRELHLRDHFFEVQVVPNQQDWVPKGHPTCQKAVAEGGAETGGLSKYTHLDSIRGSLLLKLNRAEFGTEPSLEEVDFPLAISAQEHRYELTTVVSFLQSPVADGKKRSDQDGGHFIVDIREPRKEGGNDGSQESVITRFDDHRRTSLNSFYQKSKIGIYDVDPKRTGFLFLYQREDSDDLGIQDELFLPSLQVPLRSEIDIDDDSQVASPDSLSVSMEENGDEDGNLIGNRSRIDSQISNPMDGIEVQNDGPLKALPQTEMNEVIQNSTSAAVAPPPKLSKMDELKKQHQLAKMRTAQLQYNMENINKLPLSVSSSENQTLKNEIDQHQSRMESLARKKEAIALEEEVLNQEEMNLVLEQQILELREKRSFQQQESRVRDSPDPPSLPVKGDDIDEPMSPFYDTPDVVSTPQGTQGLFDSFNSTSFDDPESASTRMEGLLRGGRGKKGPKAALGNEGQGDSSTSKTTSSTSKAISTSSAKKPSPTKKPSPRKKAAPKKKSSNDDADEVDEDEDEENSDEDDDLEHDDDLHLWDDEERNELFRETIKKNVSCPYFTGLACLEPPAAHLWNESAAMLMEVVATENERCRVTRVQVQENGGRCMQSSDCYRPAAAGSTSCGRPHNFSEAQRVHKAALAAHRRDFEKLDRNPLSRGRVRAGMDVTRLETSIDRLREQDPNCSLCRIQLVSGQDGEENYRHPGRLSIDRIIPGALGGRYHNNNIWLLCWPCNDFKSDLAVHLASFQVSFFAVQTYYFNAAQTWLTPVSEMLEDSRLDSRPSAEKSDFLRTHPRFNGYMRRRQTRMRRSGKGGSMVDSYDVCFAWGLEAATEAFAYEQDGYLFFMVAGGPIMPLELLSPDRVDSSLGYEPFNVRFFPGSWNMLKSNLPDDTEVIGAITGYRTRRVEIESLYPVSHLSQAETNKMLIRLIPASEGVEDDLESENGSEIEDEE